MLELMRNNKRSSAGLVPVRTAGVLADTMILFIKHPARIQTMGCESLPMVRNKYNVHKVNAPILESLNP